MHRVLIQGLVFWISDHAVERWQERVRPGLDHEQAVVDMRRILPVCELTEVCPSWTGEMAADGVLPNLWILVADGIALPIIGQNIATTLTRSSVSPQARENRREYRQTRKSKHRPHGKVRARERARHRDARSRLDGAW